MKTSKPVLPRLITIPVVAVLPNCQILAENSKVLTACKEKANPANKSAAGEITGRVSFKVIQPKSRLISMVQDFVCAHEVPGPAYLEDCELETDGSLPNVFVYVKSGLNGRSFTMAEQPVNLTQVGCLFRPHVFGVIVAQPIEMTSKDPTTHNVHFAPRISRNWNHSMPPGAPLLRIQFTKPNVMIPITCNNHP